MATITVTNLNDSGAGSLRQAIADAGQEASTISFASSLSGGTITLQSVLGIATGQDVSINGDIDGDGVGDITISGDANGDGVRNYGDVRLLKVNKDSRVVIDSLALTESYTVNRDGAPDNDRNQAAAAITNFGDLTITNSLVADNVSVAANYGETYKTRAATLYSAIARLGDPNSTLTITDTLFEDNKAYGGNAEYASTGGNGDIAVAPEAVAGVFHIYSDVTITRTGFGGLAQGGLTYGDKDGSNAVVGVRRYAGDLTGPDDQILIGIQAGSSITPGAPQGAGAPVAGAFGVLGTISPGTTVTVGVSGTSEADNLSAGGEGTATVLLGFGGDDTLQSSAAENDSLYGGAGSDVIRVGVQGSNVSNAVVADGGADDDFIQVFDARGDHVFRGGQGNDRISFLSSGATAPNGVTVDLSNTAAQAIDADLTAEIDGIENLVATAFNDLLTGNAAANNIDGLFGVDTIFGGEGNDTIKSSFTGAGGESPTILRGDGGDDLILFDTGAAIISGAGGEGTVDDGNDTFQFTDENLGGAISLATGQPQQVNLNTSVSLRGIENLIGSEQDDSLTGDGGANRLEGAGGGDLIIGGGGNDTILGGAAADVIIGGSGNDMQFGGAGNDGFEHDAGVNTIDGGADADSVEFGGAFSDFAFARAGSGLKATGAGGVSTIVNVESFTFTDGAKSVAAIIAATATEGADQLADLLGLNSLAGRGGNDRILGQAGADTLRGGAGNDTLIGGGDNDRLFGDGGNDRLIGGGGNDRLVGGGANDRLSGGGGNDRAIGGAGRDTVIGGAGNDTLTGGGANDRLIGGGGRDREVGGAGRDALFGGGANDVLIGGGGNDRLVGGAGNDRLLGGGGRDNLIGGGGRDNLNGGAGRDVLNGGGGNDILTGGGGPDRFVFGPNQGRNVVRDFTDGVDRIVINGVPGFEQLAITGQGDDTFAAFRNTVVRLLDVSAGQIDADDFLF